MSVDARQEVLKNVAAKLNGNTSGPLPRAEWEVLELGWCREPYDVKSPKIWHPKPAVSRKASILKGMFPDDVLRSIGNALHLMVPQDEVEIEIKECSILFFDYGICALEHVFEFRPLTTSSEPNWLDSPFWAIFKRKMMAAVEGRKLGVLNEAHWPNMQKILVDAFNDAVKKLKLPNQSGMVDFHKIFGVPQDNQGHSCASFGINFILFGYFGDQLLGPPSEALSGTVRRIIGRPISQVDGAARSDDLAYVFYGALHPLVIIRRHPEKQPKEAAGAVDAARVMLRSLWMGYSVLAEAPRGLMALQADYYLGYAHRHKAARVRREVKNLDRAGQTFELLIAEFHFSMFWESEIEYDIYHSAYEQWRMKELAEFVKDSLAAAAKTAEVLRREIDRKRQFWISVTLAFFTTFTLFGVFGNLFSLSRQEWDNFQMPSHPFIVENMQNYFSYHPVIIGVFSACVLFFILILWLNIERAARD
jgi:hypothetical protein